jgi:hypothetical protein
VKKNYSIVFYSNFLSQLSRQIQVQDYRNLNLIESEDLGYIGMNDTIPKKTTFLVPPLPLVEEAKDKDEKWKATNIIKSVLKQRAGSTATAPTYKLKGTTPTSSRSLGFAREMLWNGLISKRPFWSFGDRMA